MINQISSVFRKTYIAALLIPSDSEQLNFPTVTKAITKGFLYYVAQENKTPVTKMVSKSIKYGYHGVAVQTRRKALQARYGKSKK